MFFYNNSEYTLGFNPLVLLLITLSIVAYTGHYRFHSVLTNRPLNIIEKLINWFDHKLNRTNRSQIDRSIRGMFSSLVILLICGTFGWCITLLSQTLPFAWILELTLLIALINPGSIHQAVRQVEIALRNNSLEDARSNLATLTTQAPEKMDAHGVARVAIEFLATSLITDVIAPFFWYVLLGFPGLVLYKAVTVMYNKLGQQTEHYRNFGLTSVILQSIFIAIPAQMSGFLTLLASLFLPTSRPTDVLQTIIKNNNKYHNYNLGIGISAFAGALNVALSGPKQFSQAKLTSPWIGTGTAQATFNDIRRGLYLYNTAYLLNGLFLIGLIIYSYT
jgi:adenosylcobinamide-phosphate synthase